MLVLLDTDTGIGHTDANRAGINRAVFRVLQTDRDATLLGKLDGVGQEIDQDLAQLLTVTGYFLWRSRIDLHPELQGFFLQLRLHQFNNMTNKRTQINRFRRQ